MGFPRKTPVAFLSAVLAAGVAAAGADSAASASYRVVSATASARLLASSGTRTSLTSSQAQLTVALRAQRQSLRTTLSRRGGRLLLPITATVTESARLRERQSSTSPYVEQRCRDRRTSRTRGGLVLSPVAGGKLRVSWAFPHARMGSCPGPRRAGVILASKMTKAVSARLVGTARLRLTLAGSAAFREGAYRGTYRWRAVLVLARV